MSFYEPPQEALIYKGNYDAPRKHGSLQAVFSDVAGSSQHYRVIVKGFSTNDDGDISTPQDMANIISDIISQAHLEHIPDLHAVAETINNILRHLHTEGLQENKDLGPFDDVPAIITLHKPGKFQSADEIMTSHKIPTSLDKNERTRYKRKLDAPVPETI